MFKLKENPDLKPESLTYDSYCPENHGQGKNIKLSGEKKSENQPNTSLTALVGNGLSLLGLDDSDEEEMEGLVK